jgi:L-glutamine-phosphate cytidylyltransferase
MTTLRPSAERVTTAVVLAAGSGRRLLPLTQHRPKCLALVAGRSILARFLASASTAGLRRVVIVTGHLGHQIEAFVRAYRGALAIETVRCPDFAVTNNIVSLHAVRDDIEGPALVADGDLVLSPALLRRMLEPNRLAVDVYDPRTMAGSTVSLGTGDRITAMQVGRMPKPATALFKTVNLTSLSRESWRALGQRIDARVRAGDTSSFYEAALADLLAVRAIDLQAVRFTGQPWAEIDCANDLALAERRFVRSGQPTQLDAEAV